MKYTEQFRRNGFAIIDNIYSTKDISDILHQIEAANTSGDTFRKSADLFAIRQCLKEIPGVVNIIFNEKLKEILRALLGDTYFVSKSIYFDKPPSSNWYVAYHQDLTISVDRKLELEGFNSWTIKQNQFAVQPPFDILQNIVTVRIHLDDTDAQNGALMVIPASHEKGICRPEKIDRATEEEVSCSVPAGGIMLMKPLLLHSSGRTTNNEQRRVIHIEFSNKELPAGLNWSERINMN